MSNDLPAPLNCLLQAIAEDDPASERRERDRRPHAVRMRAWAGTCKYTVKGPASHPMPNRMDLPHQVVVSKRAAHQQQSHKQKDR
jgi:hypothetical protein